MAGRRGTKGRRGDATGALSRSAGFDDIPKDDEDLFEASRDQILLEGYDRAANDSDEDMDVGLNNREVLGIDEAPSDEDQDSDLEEEQAAEEYDDDAAAYSSQKKQKNKKADIVVSSDDDDDDDDDDEEEDGEDEQEPHENDRGWGTNKRAYYNTNDLDAMDSDSEIDEEQARQLELKEVKRLQKKSRSAMDDSDFGLGGDDADGHLAKSAKDAGREQRRRELDGDDTTPSTRLHGKITSASAAGSTNESSRRALLAKLQQTSPEAVALAGEYADMLEEFGRADSMLKQIMTTHPEHASLEVMHVYYQTLATYITTMTFYFHLRASPEFVNEPSKLRTHPVMQRMMRLKQGLSVMEDLGLTFGPQHTSVTDGGLSSEEMDDMYMLSQGSEDDDLGDLDEDELADLMMDAEASGGKENTAPAKAKKTKTNKQALRASEEDDDYGDFEDVVAEPKQKKNKAIVADKSMDKKKPAKDKRPEPVAPLAAGLADLDDEPTLQVKLKKKGVAGKSATGSNPFAASGDSTSFDDATFGELSGLSSIESAERAARKRTLQFHASAIESKALQRSKAAKERQSGDADIPYRDRERSRAGVEAAKAARESKLQQQLNGGAGKDVALDGEDGWGEADEKDWRDVMGQPMASSRAGADEGDDDDADYYDLVASSRKRARAEAKAEYDDARNAERFALMEDNALEDGQHRAITRQIEKNKGLTPHRPKTSRNPRVKKRLKYEAAKKKLGSRQAVFKGGQSTLQGGYGGEASGISTHLVKSRKLG